MANTFNSEYIRNKFDNGEAVMTWELKTKSDRIRVVNCVNPANHKLTSSVGSVIEMAHAYIHPVMVKGDKEGEKKLAPRVIIIDKDGETWGCASWGVYNALLNIFDAFGSCSEWDEPLGIAVTSENKDGKNKVGLKVVG